MNNMDKIGEIGYNNDKCKMTIISYRSYNDIDVLFVDYNYIVVNRSYSDFEKGKIKCPYNRSVCGVGYLGNESDLKEFGDKFNLNLTKDVKEVNMVTYEIKYKKPSKKKGMRKTEWIDEWVDMYEWNLNFKDEVYAKIDMLFKDDITSDELTNIFDGKMTDRSTSCWYPKLMMGIHRDLRIIGGRKQPRYPVYVISKGRHECKSWHTSFRMSQLGINHYIVVEPQELDLYKENFTSKYVTVIPMDMKYKYMYNKLCKDERTGPGAVRNFCWDDSIKKGFKFHWVFDDNIDGFSIFFRGHRLLSRTAETLCQLEDFIERYNNIAIGGLNYLSFCKSGDRVPPFVKNTRIYSMLLIRNDIPFRWRGTWNEDTILSLDVLTNNWTTVQFNLFLGEKLTTQKKKGGNTDEFYEKDGTYDKTNMLVDMYPEYCKAVEKFHRYHHQVDYSKFTHKLNRVDNYNEIVDINNKVNDGNMMIIRIPRELCNTENDNSEYLWEHRNEFERVDNTNIYL